MIFPEKEFKALNAIVARLDYNYIPWREFHRKLADFILPARYSWLNDSAVSATAKIVVQGEKRSDTSRNEQILDSTGTKAARDLAAGMLNSVTSPARPWFNLRVSGFPTDGQLPGSVAIWLEEVRRRMLLVLAESNFYNSMAMLFLDMVVFGTSGMIIYEDFDDVIRCYNFPVGEFRIAQDARRNISTCARTQAFTVEQLVEQFGLEECPRKIREKYNKGDSELYHTVRVAHLIEPNRKDNRHLPGGFEFREFYWCLDNNPEKTVLRQAGFTEKPGGWPRWETIGSEDYGLSPGMDALPDIIQLQHETLRKAEALDKMTDPPLVLDTSMKNQRGSANPGSKFYAPSHSNLGARPLYTVAMPLGELSADIVAVQTRVREAFFNDLFRMISQLQTVRTATEIDARREEKLILMGAVLERLENEALDPFIVRVFGIMKRKGLIPPPPPEYGDLEIEVQYVSVLSDAQRAVGTGVIERYMQVIGNVAALVPEIKNLPNWEKLLREYAIRLNVPAIGVHTEDEMAEIAQQEAQLAQAERMAAISNQLASAGKNLGGIDVGGGQNAVQAAMGL